MTSGVESTPPQLWKTPAHDRTALVAPSGPALPRLAEGVQAARRSWTRPWLDTSLADLSIQGRREAADAARKHTLAFRPHGRTPPDDAALWLVTGHQPSLFHPGVWYKNFVLSALGDRCGGFAVNFLADHDVVPAPSVRVPQRHPAETVLTTVAFDRAAEPIPWEERRVLDEATFGQFDGAAAELLGAWYSDPIVVPLWNATRGLAGKTDKLGLRLAAARHAVEAAYGLATWEAPLSAWCDGDAFRRFALRVFLEAASFRAIHNTALAEYRRENRVRSHRHPVPQLESVGDDWVETPFWLWTRAAPRRRALYVRRTADRIELSDLADVRLECHWSGPRSIERVLDAWRAWRREGFKIRPRALITTMFVRLVLADLFLHGVGGAKYDRLTDVLIDRFVGVEPPPFAVATATVRLPIPRPEIDAAHVWDLEIRLRELAFHPERFALPGDEVHRLAAEKSHWVHQQLPRGSRGDRHRHIVAVNAALARHVEPLRLQMSRELAAARQELRAARRLASREFVFCLFPGEFLGPALLDLVPQVA